MTPVWDPATLGSTYLHTTPPGKRKRNKERNQVGNKRKRIGRNIGKEKERSNYGLSTGPPNLSQSTFSTTNSSKHALPGLFRTHSPLLGPQKCSSPPRQCTSPKINNILEYSSNAQSQHQAAKAHSSNTHLGTKVFSYVHP
jgi:hypothetical protein